MKHAVLLLVVSALLLTSLSAFAAGAEDNDCTVVEHDLRGDEAFTEAIDSDGSGESVVSNTKVVMEDSEAFARFKMTNPNGYCTSLVLMVPDDVLQPADLGTIEADDGEHVAEWRAVYDFDTADSYTRITADVRSGAEDVTFAPSKARVFALSWTGEARQASGGILGTISSLWDREPDLEETQYEINEPAGSQITIQLTDGGDREIDDWIAMYEDSDGVWRPLGTDTRDPVYYEESPDAIHVTFNEERTLDFRVNPGLLDRLEYDRRSFAASLRDTLSGGFFR